MCSLILFSLLVPFTRGDLLLSLNVHRLSCLLLCMSSTITSKGHLSKLLAGDRDDFHMTLFSNCSNGSDPLHMRPDKLK